jgi:hypothetical protein
VVQLGNIDIPLNLLLCEDVITNRRGEHNNQVSLLQSAGVGDFRLRIHNITAYQTLELYAYASITSFSH